MKLFKSIIVTTILLASTSFAKVNINTANVDELSALKGIGEVKAEAIIKYRTEHGEFKSIEELTNIKGIGDSTVNKIKADIKLKGETDLSDVGQ
ncbi:helix-hairpin-helix domain-containing protein [Cardiobacteriaceae bacterium TAE3-ERU3]|nr:helix-hairpin-helix domain-containing protein [Cardiobacteriaceae bacterium TAE3-ERU3]